MQDRYALAARAGWRASDNLHIKARRACGRSTDQGGPVPGLVRQQHHRQLGQRQLRRLQRAGQFLPRCRRLGGLGEPQWCLPELRKLDQPLQESHTLLVTGLNAEWKTGDVEQQGRPVLFGGLAQESLGGHLSGRSISAEPGIRRARTGSRRTARRPGSIRPIRPSRPRADSAQQRSNVNGTGQSDGPEETRDTCCPGDRLFARTSKRRSLRGEIRRSHLGSRKERHLESVGPVRGHRLHDVHSSERPGLAGVRARAVVVAVECRARVLQRAGLHRPAHGVGRLRQPSASSSIRIDAVPAGSEHAAGAHQGQRPPTTATSTGLQDVAKSAGKPLTEASACAWRTLKTDELRVSRRWTHVTYSPVSIENDYTETLPSLNAILASDGRSAAALRRGIAISRPPLDALVTGFSLNSNGHADRRAAAAIRCSNRTRQTRSTCRTSGTSTRNRCSPWRRTTRTSRTMIGAGQSHADHRWRAVHHYVREQQVGRGYRAG